jgi:hypothetical protein
MNQDYRSIYNTQTNTYVAVSSNTPARGKTASARTNIRRCVFGLSAIAALMAPVSGAWAGLGRHVLKVLSALTLAMALLAY